MSSALPPPPPLPPPAAPGARPTVRWGVGDAAWAFLVGLLASVLAGAFVIDASKPVQLIVLVGVQDFTMIAWIGFVARAKGTGSLRTDFGFTVRARDFSWLLAGIGIQVAALLPTELLVQFYGHTANQDVVNTADKAHAWQIPVIAAAVALLAPVTEELLFRGVLLRALLRRTSPDVAVFATAGVFGLVHVAGDPSIGSLVALPAIMLLGVVSGSQAVKTGNLSRSIMLHVGFNALSAVLIFTT